MQADISLISVVFTCILTVFVAMKAQRLLDAAIPLALLFALSSNYLIAGLSGSGFAEIAIRGVIAYAILRSSAELLKRGIATHTPRHMRYSTEQPVIEFEEVQS